MDNNINIEIVGVKIETLPAKTAGKTYNQMTVTHKDLATGKLDGKKLVEFYTDKALYKTLSESKAGDFFTVSRIKNDKGYWDWQEAARQDSPPVVEQKPAYQGGGGKARTGYDADLQRERFEFDKQKQPLIIRQSCLSSAVAFGVAAGLESKEVLNLAQEFVNWVQKDGMAFMPTDTFPE